MCPYLRRLLPSLLCAAAFHPAPAQPPSSPQSPNPASLPNAPRPTALPDPQTEAAKKAQIHAQADEEVKQEETQRILTVVPNFNTVISGHAVPLSKGQKTDLALHASFDPFNYVAVFILAGANELSTDHKGYRWGPAGYFERVGANFADIVDSTMLAGAVYPILLRQDPRYFRQAAGPIRSRIRHALLAPFVCRGDNSLPQPNFSNLLGNLSAGAISNLYHPATDRGVSLTFANFAIVTLEGSLGNIGLEFSPDVGAYLRRRRHHATPANPPPPTPSPDPH